MVRILICFGFDFTIKKITLHVTHYNAAVNAASTRLRLYIYGGIERFAYGVQAGDENAIIFPFDLAVGANDKFKVELQRASGIMIADVTILIEI